MAKFHFASQPSAARPVSGIFFPARIPLGLDGGVASPAVLEKKVLASAYTPSYSIGQLVLQEIGGIEITSRGLNKTAVKIGSEMVADRDGRIEAYFSQPLTLRRGTAPQTPLSLACISVDGGRMQTRDEVSGNGVHNPHWRENKNALFLRMKSDNFTCDPHPDLPTCFASPEEMQKLLRGAVQNSPPDSSEPICAGQTVSSEETTAAAWRPERLFRTCLSSLQDSDTFGRSMEVEADARGFYHAQKKAFVSDGLPYNWTIQQRHFRDFTPILDFTHAVEHLYEAARCLHDHPDQRWEDYLRWAHACWLGKVTEVIRELRTHQQRLGGPGKETAQDDPRKLLADVIGYLENNACRMDYPRYRRQGLPTTSAHMESLVKEINARVKGTEKFWNDGASGEAILQIRAAALCDDDRLRKFLRNRPGHPFHPNVTPAPMLATAN